MTPPEPGYRHEFPDGADRWLIPIGDAFYTDDPDTLSAWQTFLATDDGRRQLAEQLASIPPPLPMTLEMMAALDELEAVSGPDAANTAYREAEERYRARIGWTPPVTP